MNRLWMSGAAAVMAMSIASVGAQTPQSTPQTQPPTQTPQTQAPTQQPSTAAQSVTVQGCVYQEKDIPGRTPNVAERAGVLEDYILVTSDSTASATAGTSGTTPPATAGTTGTAAMAGKAFKLEQIADDRLRAVVGKRVEVTGRVDKDNDTARTGTAGTSGTATGTGTATGADKSVGPDRIELPEFEVTSIKEVEGTCPATPDIKK